MNRRQWTLIVIIAFFIGAFGSIIFGRFFIPYLSAKTGWQFLTKLSTSSPIVINRTQQVQLNEGVNLIDLTKQSSSFVVSFYTSETNPSFLGNGIIMTTDGLIFTTRGVVGSRHELSASLNNSDVYKATVRAVDPKSDIAVLTIDAKNLNVPGFADSLSLNVGQKLFVLGESTKELNRSFGQGFVTNSALATIDQLWRPYSTEVLEDSFETDVLVNSARFVGSPIMNLDGKVVGMNTGSSNQKIIASENLQTALNSYLASGKIIRPRLGLSYFNLSKTIATLKGLPRPGVLVVKADEGSPSAGKFLANDLIFEVDGQSLENQSFEQIINRHSIGSTEFKLLRQGKEMVVNVNLVATK